MKRNFRRNGIVALNSDRAILSQVDDIKLEVLSNSPQRLLEPVMRRLKLRMTFNLLSEANINILEEPFTLEELKDVIWNYDSEKS